MSVLTYPPACVDCGAMAPQRTDNRVLETGMFPLAQCVLALAIVFAPVSACFAAGSYEFLFREGTLDAIPESAALDYQRIVSAPGSRSLEVRNTGPIRLQLTPDGMAEIHFGTQGMRRRVGAFPASIGNPLAMYFLETVVRDLSGLAGGSPFYMRNRIKAELLRQHPVHDVTVQFGDREVKAHSIVLYPFRDDPASDRMRGVETLALSVTFSSEIPGWYYALKAETTAERGERAARANTLPPYESSILFQGLEGAR